MQEHGFQNQRTEVWKVGGSLLLDFIALKKTALRIVVARKQGIRLVVVVSAMKGVTDKIEKDILENHPDISSLKKARMLASGEIRCAKLMSSIIRNLGVECVSFSGTDLGITTCGNPLNAEILSVDAGLTEDALDRGEIVIVAGFHGTDKDGNFNVLGRGGSDTTAVAYAKTLNADVCKLFKDCGCICSADPKIVGKNIREIPYLTYEELAEMSSLGAKVVNSRASQIAMEHNIRLVILPEDQSDKRSTVILTQEELMKERGLEAPAVTGITLKTDEARFTIRKVPDEPGTLGKILTAISEIGVSVNTIIQNTTSHGFADISITAPKNRLPDIIGAIEALNLGQRNIETDTGVATVSLVGIGMVSRPGVAAKASVIMGELGINIEATSTAEIKYSMQIRANRAEEAIRALAQHFHPAEEIAN